MVFMTIMTPAPSSGLWIAQGAGRRGQVNMCKIGTDKCTCGVAFDGSGKCWPRSFCNFYKPRLEVGFGSKRNDLDELVLPRFLR